MTMEPMVKSARAARYVGGTEFAEGIGRGGRPARPTGRLPVEGVAIIKLGRHLTGILQCSSSPSCCKTKTSVCDVLALVTIAFGLRKAPPVATLVAGAAQHR